MTHPVKLEIQPEQNWHWELGKANGQQRQGLQTLELVVQGGALGGRHVLNLSGWTDNHQSWGALVELTDEQLDTLTDYLARKAAATS